MDILNILVYILFVLAAIVLIVVILLQEGRGGGFGEALGVHGRETFGAGARGINTFTAVVAGVFLVAALSIHMLNRTSSGSSVLDQAAPPAEPGATLPPFPPPPGG